MSALKLKLAGIPTHLTMDCEVIERDGIYFGSTYTFTANTEAAEFILIAAFSDMLESYSPVDIAHFVARHRDRAGRPVDVITERDNYEVNP